MSSADLPNPAGPERTPGTPAERTTALQANAAAVVAIASAVEGTLGPKGLNSMLVDRYGEVTITNDGATILERMEINHPAARLVIGTAQAQAQAVGDGTTTATLLAAALVSEGVRQVRGGVPVIKIIEGLQIGMRHARAYLEEQSRPVEDAADPRLRQAALIAGRGEAELADLTVAAAAQLGFDRLREEDFRLDETVLAQEGAPTELVAGLVLDRTRLNRQMPREVAPATIVLIDDALEPEELEAGALGTEAGFQRYLRLQEEFLRGLAALLEAGANCFLVRRGISDAAEELLTAAGALAVRRLSRRDLARLAEATGARPIKRASLKKPPAELAAFFGFAERVVENERFDHLQVLGGAGRPAATLLVGAATREVRQERQRIAEDAAGAVQAAVRGGVLPGGGACEIACARHVARFRSEAPGMAAYGIDCLVEALKRPLAQIILNAGFNPLEKVEQVWAEQSATGNGALAVNCDSGQIVDMLTAGIVDAAPVKHQALQAALEIAEAILRINTIIRQKPQSAELPDADSR
ncbi:MAG TPA: TCP-1/cpn60 chaperonin family protein [Armatimonadota bacterium]|jgi:chaperonin GroEL (HSP60 family)